MIKLIDRMESMKESKSVNAGVHAQTGFALQRNTALYILLSDYHSKFEKNDYFICLEHHDDFLFCFLDKNGNYEKIDVYQSKKASSDWTINNELIILISKLLNTGTQLIQDESLCKSDNYLHELYFSSNRLIKLESKVKSSPLVSTKIDETNCLVSFKKLPNEIQETIKNKLNIKSNNHHKLNLEKLHFFYIDLAKTDAAQQEQLVGKITNLFGKKVIDPKAAKEAILQLFRNVETVFNQGNKAKLLDRTKQVSSKDINDAIGLITTTSKAFDYWRSQESRISEKLKIRPFEKCIFSQTFETAFDYFKSIEEQEHRKILIFVNKNHHKSNKYSEEEVVLDLYDLFLKENNTNFKELELKAIIYAAYFETIYKKDLTDGEINKI